MTTNPDAGNPFQGLAEEASATLRECLVAEGLAAEIPTVMLAFERAVHAAVAAVEGSAPDGLSLDFALAYLTGRIAKEQSIALQSARGQVRAARTRAEQHWRAAIEAERRRVAPEQSTDSATATG
jgi:hypothetical protein